MPGKPTRNFDFVLQSLKYNYKKGDVISDNLILRCLQCCIRDKNLLLGTLIHQFIISSGLESVAILVEHLIRLFVLSGNLFGASLIFSKVCSPNVYTWHAAILAHVVHQRAEDALNLYVRMQQEDTEPNKFIYLCVLKACSTKRDLDSGRRLHYDIVKSGIEPDRAVSNMLVYMYSKCGSLFEGKRLFDLMFARDIISWGIILEGCVDNGQGSLAFELFNEMQDKGTKPNKVILLCMLKACVSLKALIHGRSIHDRMIRSRLESDPALSSLLIDMYSKCGSLPEAGKILDSSNHRNVVSWCALIGGHCQQNKHVAAFQIFERMQQEGTEPNEFIFSCLLNVCASIGDLGRGKFLHDQIIKSTIESDEALSNSLIDMYAQCGCLDMAQNVFENLSSRNVTSWGTIITGYMQHGHAVRALTIFKRMQEDGTRPNLIIYSSIFKACANAGAIKQGMLVHHLMLNNEHCLDAVAGSTLTEMYAACGYLAETSNVFDRLQVKNIVCWGVLIAGCAEHGCHRLAGKYLEYMEEKGMKPNAGIFTSLLVSCNKAADLKEGEKYFKSMTEKHGIKSTVEHVHCMVDLLGRAGHLVKAKKLLESMPITSDLSGWMSLLSACSVHGSPSIGRHCFDLIVSTEAMSGAAYALMCKIYSDARMWEDYHHILNLKNQLMGSRNEAVFVVREYIHEKFVDLDG